MARLLRHLLIVTILFLPCLSVTGQDVFVNDAVDRVIKLRSSEQPAPPKPRIAKKPVPVVKTTSAQTPVRNELPDPTKIQFDEIVPSGTFVPQTTTAEPKVPAQLAPPVSNAPQQMQQRGPVVDRQMNVAKPTRVPMMTPVSHPKAAPTAKMIEKSNMAPQISTRIIAPKAVNLGQNTLFRIQLQNVSQQVAQQVVLVATLPEHSRLLSARPKPTNVNGRDFQFDLGQIGNHQMQEVQIELVPQEKQPLQISTQVQVLDRQNMAVMVQQPMLKLDVTGTPLTNTGKWFTHVITVENHGDGPAENIRIARKQDQAMHVDQNEQEILIRRLAPGEKENINVRTFAQQAGDFELGFVLTSNHVDAQEAKRPVRVFQPELKVSALGPKMNFVKRDGIYTIQIDNSGQVDVTNVNVALVVPEGLEVSTISRKADIKPKSGEMIWRFEKIPAKTKETIQLRATSTRPGSQTCQIEIRSNETQAEQIQLATQVIARADVSINLANAGGPVEVGSRTNFVLQVTNKGSSTASKLDVNVVLAASLMPVSDDAYFVNEVDNSIRFTTSDVAPGETKEFNFAAVGVSAGEHVVRSVVKMEGSERSLIAEDSVYVFETNQAEVSESLEPTIHRK